MNETQKNYTIRAHHLIYAYSMAATLRHLDQKDLEMSTGLIPLLEDGDIDPDLLTENDLLFFQLLNWLSTKIRVLFKEELLTQSEYSRDLFGNNPDVAEKLLDSFVIGICKTILAVYLPYVNIQLGELLDNICKTCEVGSHCHEDNLSDVVILKRLSEFLVEKGILEFPSPEIHMRRPQTVVEAKNVRSFLDNQLNFRSIANLKLEDGVVMLQEETSFIMGKPRYFW